MTTNERAACVEQLERAGYTYEAAEAILDYYDADSYDDQLKPTDDDVAAISKEWHQLTRGGFVWRFRDLIPSVPSEYREDSQEFIDELRDLAEQTGSEVIELLNDGYLVREW